MRRLINALIVGKLYPVMMLIARIFYDVAKIELNDINFYCYSDKSSTNEAQNTIEALLELLNNDEFAYLEKMIKKAFSGYTMYVISESTKPVSDHIFKVCMIPLCGQVKGDEYLFMQQFIKFAEETISFRDGVESTIPQELKTAEHLRKTKI